jgi:hypothetical protein
VAVNGAETARAAQLRENFGIPDKPRGLEETRKFWREVPPQWIRIAAELGIKLD